MLTVSCKTYTARHDAEGITLEIAEPQPVDVLPRLVKRADAAARLAVSPRHLDSLVAAAGIRPVDGLPVRFRETDLLCLTQPRGANTAQAAPMPRPVSKPASAPVKAKATAISRPADGPRSKTKLHV